MRLALRLALATSIGICDVNAAVTLVREHRLAPPHDRRILFAMAVTPGQDVLSLIANPQGKWRFSRVRNWFDKGPHYDTITVPGLVLGEHRDWFGPWEARLLVTPNGMFAICVASALRSGHQGHEEIVSVVDLAAFRVVATLHGHEVPELRGDFRLFHLDGGGHLVAYVHTYFPRHPGDDPFKGGRHVKLAMLSLPNLRVTHSCEYSEWMTSGEVERREGESSCAELLAHEKRAPTLTAFKATWSSGEEAAAVRQRPPECASFHYSAHISPDGKYEREVCVDSHRGFWGTPVIRKVVERIYLVRTGEMLGLVKEPRFPVKSRFVSVGDRGYLLVMEGGTRLLVYKITD